MRGVMDDRALVERQLGRPPRAFRRVASAAPSARRPSPSRRRTTTPASRSRRRTTSPARSSSRPSRGSRRPAASSAGAPPSTSDPELAADLERATGEQRGSAGSCGGQARRATTARRSTSGSAAAATRAGSSASTRTSPTRSPARATSSASGSSPSSSRSGRRERLLHRPGGARIARRARRGRVESARREWDDGQRRLLAEARRRAGARPAARAGRRRRRGAAPPGRRRRSRCAELAAAYAGADAWSREIVAEQAPAPGWPRTLSLVEAAAFHLYARGAHGLRSREQLAAAPARRRAAAEPALSGRCVAIARPARRVSSSALAVGRALEDGPAPGGTRTTFAP